MMAISPETSLVLLRRRAGRAVQEPDVPTDSSLKSATFNAPVASGRENTS
jgi:hypothetical protein